MKRLSLVILWHIIFVSLYSQPFNFKHLEVADGLSNNSVYAILKDKDGFMWFGTNAGLNRFDGYTFKVFRHLHDDKHSLPDNYVKEIIESPNGNLWIKMGTGYTMFDKAANQFNNDTKNFMKKLGSNGLPECIYVDSNEQTWFFVGWEGFYRYDKNNNTKFVSLYNFGLPEFGVSAINECNDGILFQYNNGILVCIDPSEMKPKWIKDEISLQMNGKQAFYSLFVDKEQCIWISNNSNLYVYDTVSDEWRHDLEEPWKSQNDIIHSVSQDNIGRIWVGKDYGGIDVFDKKTGHLTNLVNDKNNTRSLSHNTVYKIYTDKYGTTWIGTYKKGISYYSESMFKFNMYELGDITCVEQADDKHVWLGTNNDGLLLWNIEEAKVKKHYNFTSPIVSLLKTSDNRLWIGTFNNGLYSLDIKGLTKYTVNNNGLLGNNVWSMAEADGKLWIGFLDGGIQYIDMKSNKLTKYDEINEEINQMKFRFFTNISHELRTPLTLIISPLEDLLKSTKDESQKSMLMLIYRNAQRLLILVNQLLDFRKSEMTGHTLSLSESDIVAYIREVCNSFLLMANKKHIQFFFFSGIDNFHMAFDADKISKIVTNLLSNAFKFTPDGGRVTVMIEHIEGTQEMLEIKVSDTGIGIPDSEKEHIFERFYQAGHKGIEESTGSGIGLSLVRDFVNLHDGSVEVFDNIGTGTVFVIQLPVKHVDLISEHIVSAVENTNEKNNEDTEKVIEQTDRRDFPLILIVDDNEDFRIFMQHSLELQYNVEIASNGEEAWEMIQQKRPDLIISDVMMPVMDGIELCKLIKNNQPTAHIPVILLTARQAVESKVEGLEIGADDYVTKPFNMTVLTLRIRKLIELSHYKQISHSTIDPTPSNIVITSLDEKLVEKAIKYVEDNISRSELSVEELSSELGMSRVHLYKKLLQITGKTPIEFIRTIRLKRAAQLLRESQLYVSEIAYEVGFNNPKYFSKYFKDEFGVLPSAYQLKEKNNK